MNDLKIEEFTQDRIIKFTIPKLKAFIKERGVIKSKKCTRKQHFIECILENKDFLFGGIKPVFKKVKKIRKVRVKKVKQPKKLFHKVLRKPKTVCYDKSKVCVGIDECGVGSLVFHCTVVACVMPTECPTQNDEYKLTMWNSITDSKKYSSNKKKLHALCEYIKEVAIEYSLVRISAKEIDRINIREARLVGFTRALNNLKTDFNKILIDGDIFYDYYKNGEQISHECVKKGDTKFRSIAAASLIGKSTRDTFMIEVAHPEFPMYGFNKNFGYCGSNHIGLIKKYGITKYHRKTFGICKQWKKLPQGNLTDFTEVAVKKDKLSSYAFLTDSDED